MQLHCPSCLAYEGCRSPWSDDNCASVENLERACVAVGDLIWHPRPPSSPVPAMEYDTLKSHRDGKLSPSLVAIDRVAVVPAVG